MAKKKHPEESPISQGVRHAPEAETPPTTPEPTTPPPATEQTTPPPAPDVAELIRQAEELRQLKQELAKPKAPIRTGILRIEQVEQDRAEQAVAYDRVKQELAAARALIIRTEDADLATAPLPAPPDRLDVGDLGRRAVEALAADHPAPDQIPYDQGNPDAALATLKAYGEAARKADTFAYALHGLGALYRWRRGEWFERHRERLTREGKSFRQWYIEAGEDKSDVSRCLTMRRAYPDHSVLVGMSATAAHRAVVKKAAESKAAKPKAAKPKLSLREILDTLTGHGVSLLLEGDPSEADAALREAGIAVDVDLETIMQE